LRNGRARCGRYDEGYRRFEDPPHLLRYAACFAQGQEEDLSSCQLLLRQVEKTEPENIFVKAIWPTTAQDTMASLADLREDPAILQTDNQSLAPKHLEVIMVRDLAGKFSGIKTFIEGVEAVVPRFYEQVGQHLRAWVPPPPKPREDVSAELQAESAETPETQIP